MAPRNGRQSRLITKMVPPAGKLNGTTNNTVNAIFMQLYSVETKMSNIRKGETVMTEAEFKKKVEQAMYLNISMEKQVQSYLCSLMHLKRLSQENFPEIRGCLQLY